MMCCVSSGPIEEEDDDIMAVALQGSLALEQVTTIEIDRSYRCNAYRQIDIDRSRSLQIDKS